MTLTNSYIVEYEHYNGQSQHQKDHAKNNKFPLINPIDFNVL